MERAMKTGRMVVAAAMLVLAASGCVDLDYTGQTFPAPGADAPVAFFTADAPMPQNEYHAIGRITLTAPDGTNSDTLRDDLIDAAREHGADAVSVVEFKRVKTGMSAAPESSYQGPNATWNRDARNAGGAYIYSNTFGEINSLEKPPNPVYEIRIKALVLVTNARFSAVTSEYRRELQAVEKQLDSSEAATPEPENPGIALERVAPPAVEVNPTADPARKPAAPPVRIELRNEQQQQPVTL